MIGHLDGIRHWSWKIAPLDDIGAPARERRQWTSVNYLMGIDRPHSGQVRMGYPYPIEVEDNVFRGTLKRFRFADG